MRARRKRLLALVILAILGLAVLAPAGHAIEGEAAPEGSARQQRASQRAARRAEREARRKEAAQRHSEGLARRERRRAELHARAEERRRSHVVKLGHKSDPNADVEIDCEQILIHYHSFNPGLNTVLQLVKIKSPPPPLLPIIFPAKNFTFEGADATSVIPIAAPVGRSTVDIWSKWDDNGLRGGFDIHESVLCEPNPAFTIEKLQSLGGPFTTETLTGAVGQTILYEMIATNTGNTPLSFSGFSDTVCDPGTIAGVSGTPVEPLGTLTIVCAHKITAADLTAGTVVNVATITGTPEEGEGGSITHESNEVVVTPKKEGGTETEKEEKERHEREQKEREERELKEKGGSSSQTPKSGVAGTSGASSSSKGKSGVLGFASATVPSLRGPQGCVRSTFTASIKSAGVSSVTFYLDGHRLRRMTASNARKGLISIRIDISKLKVGPHRVKATITMKPTSAGAKAAKATRSLTVVRCHSAVISPHFTG